MKIPDFRPIYSQPLDIRFGLLRVLRLSLNRHLPEKNWIAPHRHRFSQFLVYLTGQGSQRIGSTRHLVRPGCAFFLPPGVSHEFIETTGRRPLCLAIDLSIESPKAANREAVLANLTRAELHEIRKALSTLTRWREGSLAPREAAAVLQLLDVLLRATGKLPRTVPHSMAPVVRRVHQALEREEDSSVARIAESVGYHRDHLNRLLKQSAGVSVGQLRAEVRLRRAKSLLQTSRRIGEVAVDAGFSDPNYFTRWFRLQTGLTPGAWRRQANPVRKASHKA